MDFGCHTGNELSLYLAKNSKEYFAVDLSSSALSILKQKFEDANITNFNLLDMDILSKSFPEKEFDVIYAKAVFHHFEYFEDFLVCIRSLLKKDGIIITTDPLNTYLPLVIFRKLYRKFQKDKDWEYPFDRKMINTIQKVFKIEKLAGIMGKNKKALILYIFSKKLAIKNSKKWLKEDMFNVKINDKNMAKCLRITFLLRNNLIGNK